MKKRKNYIYKIIERNNNNGSKWQDFKHTTNEHTMNENDVELSSDLYNITACVTYDSTHHFV